MPTKSLMIVRTGQHDQRREHARRDELLDRIGAERVERVDLLRDSHGAELRGDAGADASGDHEAGEHGTQLANHRRRHEAPDVHRGAERLELHRRLQREHHPGEESGEENDAERLDADRVHLLYEVAAVERAGEDETQGVPGQEEVLLDGEHLPLRCVVEPVEIWRQEVECVVGRKAAPRVCPAKGKACAGCGWVRCDDYMTTALRCGIRRHERAGGSHHNAQFTSW